MCAVSQVGDAWTDRFRDWPKIPITTPESNYGFRLSQLEGEMSKLRKEVLQMREELKEAKAQDVANGEPDCEMEDKVKLLKQIASMVGVDLKEVFPND